MEIAALERLPALIDLSTVEEAQRSAVWTSAAPSFFPGLSVNVERGAPVGNIRRVSMSSGSLWSIRSSPALVSYVPLPDTAEGQLSFTLMMQLAGTTEVAQNARRCGIAAGDICLLDERFPFRLEGGSPSEILFLRMPRGPVLSRNPHLEHRTAVRMPATDAGVSLLGDTLASAIQTVPFMRELQRSATLVAAIHLLGAIDSEREETSAPNWRVRAALAFIELNFAAPGLCATQVAEAQRISRRRLDQLVVEATGASITSWIWKRRLEQAALDLRDPARVACTTAQIAFANGFEDPPHFSRAFKRYFGCSPSKWRQAGIPTCHTGENGAPEPSRTSLVTLGDPGSRLSPG